MGTCAINLEITGLFPLLRPFVATVRSRAEPQCSRAAMCSSPLLTMLLLKVLQDDARHSLRMHGGLISAFVAELRLRTSNDSQGGSDITRSELAEALLVATGNYQERAVTAIAAEVKRDYASLDAPAAAAMDRGLAPGQGNRPLLG